MTFAPEKRLMLGWLALIAPLPLPFNEVLEWPVLFLFLVAVVAFLGRAEDPARRWLDNRALNGLGLLYLPVLAFDTWQASQRSQLVTPLLHLILFVLVAKLFSIRQEKEKWHVLLAIFFVFVAAMATSSHITIVFYLLAVLALGLLCLARLAELHMRSALGLASPAAMAAEPAAAPAAKKAPRPRQETAPAAGGTFAGLPRPGRGALLAVAAVALIAVPIFAALPRLAQPFLTGRGVGNLGIGRVSGFSDEVSLGFSGQIRSSSEIAMRVRPDQLLQRPDELRFKGAAYDYYRNQRWLRDNDLFDELRPQDGSYRLGEGEEVASATIFLEPIESGSLLVPSETVSLSFPAGGPSRIYADGGGGLALPFAGRRRDSLEYRVGLARAPQVRASPRQRPQGGEAALDAEAVTPRMAELARRVMGEGSDEQKIRRLENHLLTEYGYTVDITDEGGDAIEDFLFVRKLGHCEYFASAMVLLLRSQGIPARFVSGFLGAEANTLEDLLVVRQSNAHAWVEAYSPELGWQVYDPTPPAGRPGAAQAGLALLARQLYEYVTFRWDRYVLTYGADDQGDLGKGLKGFFTTAWERLRSWLRGADENAAQPDAAPFPLGEPESAAAPAAAAGGLGTLPAVLIGLLVATVALAAFLLFWRRRPRSATAAYLGLRRMLETADLAVSPASPPLELRALLRDLLPGREAAADRLVALYLDEAFGGRALSPAELREVAALRPALEQGLRRRLAADRKAILKARRKAGAPKARKLAEQVET